MDVLTAISLCSGYEGLGLGLKRAIPNVRTVCYVEREAYACANLVAKIKEGKLDDAPVWDDLATFDPEPYKGMVHIIHGGYPCQGFSVAGKRLGIKDPRWVWPHIARIVKAVRPVWCVFENVAGHLSLGFPEVYRSLRSMGYKVEAGLFTAAEAGISMAEGKRLFILAQAESITGNILQGREQEGQGKTDTGRASKILGKANHKRLQRVRSTEPKRRNEFAPASFAVAPQGVYQESWEVKRALESGLDRTAYVSRSRMDRLRLLGNGVIPAQAEKAIKTLGALFE